MRSLYEFSGYISSLFLVLILSVSISNKLVAMEPEEFEDTEIRIEYGGDSIQIWDNGTGMTLAQLQVGLKLRAARDAYREPLRPRKGMFGMGMKVGILGLGWKFVIHTRSISEKTENVIEIDTRLIESGDLKLKEVPGIVYKKHLEESPLEDLESGTYIRIEDLHKTRHNTSTWHEELGRNFAPELEYDKIKMVIIDSSYGDTEIEHECSPEIIPIIPESKIEIDSLNLFASRDFGDGTRGEPIQIRGWLALRRKMASGTGLWGVHTFRKGQLVEAFHNDGPRNNGLLPKNPHPSLARLHGEVHLDMCDPNFTKVGWNTELESWTEARDELEDILTKMLDTAKAYKKGEGGGASYRKALQAAKDASHTTVSKISENELTPEEEEKFEQSRDYVKIGPGRFLKISVTQAPSVGNSPWDYGYVEESEEIAVVINTKSDLWEWATTLKKNEGLFDLITDWAVIDSLYFCLVDFFGFTPNDAVELRDKWMSKLYRRADSEE
ncbi:MAG: ATP-binding protein [Candidatus Thorarchaeota archaeon]